MGDERPAGYVSSFNRETHKWHHISPSTLENYIQCPRVPYFNKVRGFPVKEFQAQKFGTESHTQLEHYLETGQDVLNKRIAPGKDILPTPGSDLLIEFGMDGKRRVKELKDDSGKIIRPGSVYDYDRARVKVDGVPFEGYADLINPRDTKNVHVLDHKTTSDVRAWGKGFDPLLVDPDWNPETVARMRAKGEAQMTGNIQLLSYGKLIVNSPDLFPGVEVVDFTLIYYQTRGPVLVSPRTVSLTVDQINENWQKVETDARGLLSLADAKSENDVEPRGLTNGYCHAFRRECEFLGFCSKSPSEMLRLRVSGFAARNQKTVNASENKPQENALSLFARVKKIDAAPSAPAAPPQVAQTLPAPAAPAPAPVAPAPSNAQAADVLALLAGRSGSVSTTPNGSRLVFDQAGNMIGQLPPPAVQVAPAVSAPVPGAAAGGVCSYAEGDQSCTMGAGHAGSMHDLAYPPGKAPAPAVAAPVSIVPPDAPASDPSFKPAPKRGRPAKAAQPAVQTSPATAQAPAPLIPATVPSQSTGPAAAAGTASAGTVSQLPSAAIAAEPAPETAQKVTGSTGGFQLFVNCMPYGFQATPLNAYVDQKAQECAEILKVPDVRLADYGKGTASLAALIRSEPPPPGAYFAAFEPGGLMALAVETLIPLAAFAVKRIG